MSKLLIKLNEKYKSFNPGFQYELEGNLILLSGVNGAGKSQILNIIYGQEAKNKNITIDSEIILNGNKLSTNNIEFRSFRENINIPEITASNPHTLINSGNQAWKKYQENLLNPLNRDNLQFFDSCVKAQNILLERYSEEEFRRKSINIEDFKNLLFESDFVWKQADMFTNSVGEIFFNHALKVSEKMKDVGRDNFDPSILDTAPWVELNNLFEELNLEYKFKDNYFIKGVEINEQPQLFYKKEDGSIEVNQPRKLADLSDGEKTIISLCFASLSGNDSSIKKLLLLDEIDAVLNPSLIQTFFQVIERYFISKNVTVVMSTHSPASIALSPSNTSYYEVFKRNKTPHRVLEVNREEYSELQIANQEFYDKISNQKSRIEFLEGKIESGNDILIITEGKTDWKYMLSALRFFHTKGEFREIQESYFYRFGSSADVESSICDTEFVNELSDAKLRNYLNGLVESRKIGSSEISQIRIGIFDSDNKNVKTVNNHSLGVFSFKISPENISTEFLFPDSEIKTILSDKRLYIGTEFDSQSKINLTNSELSLGGESQNTNKAGKRVIIDTGVYNRSIENVALSKESFAQNIYQRTIAVSEDSWENFRHIFDNILSFIQVQEEKLEGELK
ncbi:ATP-binding protein [Tenacibaculum mesophilum]|uniref:ATP-binding protein n=1 Tax=Tenacibaculum mesophilum TaxID=104268 RepID=A0AAE9MMI1_9FLAO|nr:AAA family ATPase [Tenacibaculum mesophilum]UTD14794.1 ATP-binding protein [Tenacibaculum mesophilum]